ncbi:MAG TPA: redoxin domain-containing protein [Tepidisphaeraceae bacterium]|nr:redoxin domain-containing protein [Tepidisphaeraceae bacterium]
MLTVGDPAPDFELMTQDHTKKVKLADLRGKTVVLLFYPMDFSPVCTDEHCSFTAGLGQIAPDGDTIVFGVSTDSPFTHAAFKKQFGIGYDLLSDPTRAMVKAYGMFMGEQPFNCGKRGTVVIDKNGRIAAVEEQPILEPRAVEKIASAARKSA